MPKILLVDDSATDRRLFSEILESDSKFTVESCDDGESALEAIAQDPPDLVVTDMQMPNMDGLELVTQVRSRHPRIPVILITGAGSESLATKALRAGAAGYVPKSHSSELLTETVNHVLELTQVIQVDERLHQATKVVHYEWELANDETLIPGVLQLARQRLTECSHSDEVALLQIEVALEHALLNSIYHGNLNSRVPPNGSLGAMGRRRKAEQLISTPPFCDRYVRVTMHVGPTEARFVVRDQGDGFDVKEVSSLGLSHSLRGEFGRGLFLMWAFMDKVVFDKSGNTATLIKRFEAPAPPKAPEPEEALPDVLGALRSLDAGKIYNLTKIRTTVGRDQSCDIVINSAAVSHHHCLLFLHEGWWFVRDLKSKNGIRVNGKQHTQHLLPPAAVLSIGPHEFEVDYQPHKLGAPGITPPVDPF